MHVPPLLNGFVGFMMGTPDTKQIREAPYSDI